MFYSHYRSSLQLLKGEMYCLKKKSAIAELNNTVKLGNYSKNAIEADGYFAPLRNEPGYLALIKKMK